MKGRGTLGVLAGAAAAGAAVGVAGQRYAMRWLRRRADPEPAERFGELRGRQLTVTADDGVPLHVEVDEGDATDVTIVFCHGYTLEQACWHYQRRDLADLGRLVFWDQRSHGRSGRGGRDSATVDQLGRDLAAVLRVAVPGGPIVLVGHSMGGMTIMALADACPELFDDRVIGVGLLNTSARELGGATLGLPLLPARALRVVTPTLIEALGRRPRPVELARRITRDISSLVTRRIAFGSGEVSPSLAAFMDRMVRATPVDVVADFYPAIVSHDKQAALEHLRRVEALVIVGEMDRITPAEQGHAIAAALPDAELVVLPRAGHMTMLEEPDVVNDALRRLVFRARGSSPRSGRHE